MMERMLGALRSRLGAWLPAVTGPGEARPSRPARILRTASKAAEARLGGGRRSRRRTLTRPARIVRIAS